jgi:hypothetical protein
MNQLLKDQKSNIILEQGQKTSFIQKYNTPATV